jgi:serine/threonine-protein kinase
MLALYRSGRQAEALDAYRRTRETLDEELGIEPGPALRDLYRKILNQDASLGAPPAPPPEPPAPGRRRTAMVLVAAAIVVAAIGAAAFLLTRDSAGGLSEVPPNYVGVIDPKSNEVMTAVPVGIRPGPLAVGAGSVWVANLGDRNLTRIDVVQRAPAGDVSLGDRTPTALAFGAGAVWVAHGLRGELSRVDPQFARVSRTIAVTSRSTSTASGGVAAGRGRVWAVYSNSTLARVDAASMRVSGSTLAGALPSAVVEGSGASWVANSGDATVQRFDPATFEEGPVRAPITVGSRPAGLAFGAGALWVANSGDDSVTRIDPSTGSTFTIPVGDGPVAVAVGAGGVWVSNADAGTVSRIDPTTRDVVETIDVGNAPTGIAVAGGLVWVAVQAP